MTDHRMLRVAKNAMSVLGIWPVKLTGYKLQLYKFYHIITYWYLLIFNVTLTIKAIQVMGKDVSETATNLGVTIVYWTSAWKIKICTSPLLVNLIRSIEQSEKVIIQNTEKDILAIHHKHVKTAAREGRIQLMCGFIGISLYIISPLVENYSRGKTGDNVNKSFIYVSWFPFDEYKYYTWAYIIQFISAVYGAAYTVTTGVFLFSTMIFSRCEIKILQYRFRNFKNYVDKLARNKNTTILEDEKAVLENCILEHWKIIKFVKTLENAYKTYMLLDFTVCSFQFSMLVIQIIQTSKLDVALLAVSMYLITLALQVFLIYSNAHELIIQSNDISRAIFESEWYELSNSVKKDLMVIMMRAQKPLYISIGPLYEIRRELMLKILQALYSYICVIMK